MKRATEVRARGADVDIRSIMLVDDESDIRTIGELGLATVRELLSGE